MIQQLKKELSQLKEEKNKLQEEKNELEEENTHLRVQVQDVKRMEEKLEKLLESYGERSRYIHSWSK